MKYQIMIGILFTLLAKRKVSASELSAKYGVSVRTVYRYIDEMTCSNIPIDVSRGSQGGIYISDAFKLPQGLMTREEYARAIEAMLAMNEQLRDPVLQSALEKLRAQVKTEKRDNFVWGNILVDSGTWGDERKFSDKLSFVGHAIQEKLTLEIDYIDRSGERSQREILPHQLILKQNIWYVWAFCKTRKAFRLFKIGRIRSAVTTDEKFTPIPYTREDIPLTFWDRFQNSTDALFEISVEALPLAEEWLGIENVYERDGKYYADVVLPDDETLVGTILSVGAGFKVLSPASLVERVQREAERITALYSRA